MKRQPQAQKLRANHLSHYEDSDKHTGRYRDPISVQQLTGISRTDRALLALARLLGEIAATATGTEAQSDGHLPPTQSVVESDTAIETTTQAATGVLVPSRNRRVSTPIRIRADHRKLQQWESGR